MANNLYVKGVKEANSFNSTSGGRTKPDSELPELAREALLSAMYSDKKLLTTFSELITVSNGDQLKKIARRYAKKYPIYNDENWFPIYNFNQDRIFCPDIIYPGQDIYIPKQELAEALSYKPVIRKECFGKPQGIFITPHIFEFVLPGKPLVGKCGLTGSADLIFGGSILFLKGLNFGAFKLKLKKQIDNWLRKGITAEDIAKSAEVSAIIQTETLGDIGKISDYIKAIEMKGSYDSNKNKFLLDIKLNFKEIKIDKERTYEIVSGEDFSLTATGVEYSFSVGALSRKLEFKLRLPLVYRTKEIEFIGYIDIKLSFDNLINAFKKCGNNFRKWELFPRELFEKSIKEALENYKKNTKPIETEKGLEWNVVVEKGVIAVGLTVGAIYAFKIFASLIALAAGAIFVGSATVGAGSRSSTSKDRKTYMSLITAIQIIQAEEAIKLKR